jgi:hypothetical protein
MARRAAQNTSQTTRLSWLRTVSLAAAGLTIGLFVSYAADTVPTDVQIPGTQPVGVDNPPAINPSGNCGCHDFTANRDPESHPQFGWEGAMMGNAGRDPLFWATVAIAEQDFLPGSGGVGDLCLHCHSVGGWLEGRSTPTDGGGLIDGTDDEGVMCHFCHQLVDPDQEVNIPSPPEGSYVEEQHGDFVAYDETTGEGYYGGAEYVLNSGGTRMGPYADHVAKHDAFGNEYFRDARFCGTCHDVSNPAVGDLAHNCGTMLDPEGATSGVPGSPVAGKAAMNNPPERYGVVERTFSEWSTSAFEDLAVEDFATLPADLQTPGGSLHRAYQSSLWGNCSSTTDTYCNTDTDCPGGETCITISVNYQDGATRKFTCQTCHMAASIGKGASNAKLGGADLIRPDLPRHDQTGGSYWIQDAIKWQDDQGTLVFGGGIGTAHRDEMTHAQGRAENHLRSAGGLSATQDGHLLKVRVTNLTAHKLISGYPEGRRVFLNIKWLDGGAALIEENGAYGPLGNLVTDNDGDAFDVESILDFDSTKIYEAKPGMTRQWAQQLLSLGYPPSLVLEWNRLDNTSGHTLGELADWPTSEGLHTFHFALNNIMIHDNRIPPYGMERHESLERSILPVPASQYGNPADEEDYDYWDEVPFPVPVGAVSAEVRLYYQSTSWEYIQFLWKQNDGSATFLANEGVNMLDAWFNAGGTAEPEKHMAPPFEMALVPSMGVTAPTVNPPGLASGTSGTNMVVTGYDPGTGAISMTYDSACGATGHTVHYGNLNDVSTYTWGGADCGLDLSGTGSFVPDPGVGESIFFVMVGNNVDWEGGYGADSHGMDRPANASDAGSCARQMSVRNFCD